jgi:hypothetical protein
VGGRQPRVRLQRPRGATASLGGPGRARRTPPLQNSHQAPVNFCSQRILPTSTIRIGIPCSTDPLCIPRSSTRMPHPSTPGLRPVLAVPLCRRRPAGRLARRHCIPRAARAAGGVPDRLPERNQPKERRPGGAAEPGHPQVHTFHDRCSTIKVSAPVLSTVCTSLVPRASILSC